MYQVIGFDKLPIAILRYGKRWMRSNVFSGNKSEMEATVQKWQRDNTFPGYVSIIVPYMSHYLTHDNKKSGFKSVKKKNVCNLF